MKERELGAFFRNNHFSTIFKKDGSLYLLATDIGFAGKAAGSPREGIDYWCSNPRPVAVNSERTVYEWKKRGTEAERVGLCYRRETECGAIPRQGSREGPGEGEEK